MMRKIIISLIMVFIVTIVLPKSFAVFRARSLYRAACSIYTDEFEQATHGVKFGMVLSEVDKQFKGAIARLEPVDPPTNNTSVIVYEFNYSGRFWFDSNLGGIYEWVEVTFDSDGKAVKVERKLSGTTGFWKKNVVCDLKNRKFVADAKS